MACLAVQLVQRYATPLRYPGGKQRLAPFIAEILQANAAVGWNYAEPYAGGAGVAIELLLANVVGNIYLNDSAFPVYAFWKSATSDPDGFCRRISSASLTLEAWAKHKAVVRDPRGHSIDEVGFSTFFLNRCNRSGVLTAGVIGGKAQEGKWRIDARFPRREMIRRIERIALQRDRIKLSNMDAERFIRQRANTLHAETLVYCDPPYYARAKRLYLNTYASDDHARIASVIQQELRRPWLVSYDNHPEIVALYRRRRSFRYGLQYSAMKAYSGRELFVFSDVLAIPARSSLSCLAAPLAALRKIA